MDWDLTSYFPEFGGSEMNEFRDALERDVKNLLERVAALETLDETNQVKWETMYLDAEELWTRFSHFGSYIGCLTSTDANNEDYQQAEAAFSQLGAVAAKVNVEFLRSVSEAETGAFETFCTRDKLSDITYILKRDRQEGQFRMSSEREALAADLGVDGISAWGRLYDTVSGKLEFDITYPDGRTERLPVSQRRSLMEQPDRGIRRAAFEGGNEAWSRVEDVAASALNAISGTRLTLYGYRNIPHFLEVALFDAAVSRKTLDAMIDAITTTRELPRRILALKARTMGEPGVAWYDLGAPLPVEESVTLDWDHACSLVSDAFTKAYPALGKFTQGMFDDRWIDWSPREGKRPGGFCTGSLLTRESRIFMTYNQSMGDIRTLAHEAGHAFHSHVMRDIRPYARGYPMTLAESASTFGEMILTEGILSAPDITDAQKALMLDADIGHGAIFLLDIPTRFEFERALYEQREAGELSVTQLKDLMVETQRRVFGDVLVEGGEDPYFWASKLHFYITGVSFYNFPYTFGFLLSRGLFARYKQEGPDFLPRYEDFLRLTGSDTAEGVAKRSIDVDLEQPDFWIDAINSLEEPLAQLEALLPSVTKP